MNIAPFIFWAGFAAVMAPFRRPAPDMAPTDAKASCLYPNGARASHYAAAQGADYLALSFVRDADDVNLARRLLHETGGRLVTIEYEAERAKEAAAHVREAGLGGRFLN